MNHLDEKQLIEYRYGDVADVSAAKAIGEHLRGCAACRAEFEALERVLKTVDAQPVPEPHVSFESRMWHQLEPKIAGVKPGAGRFAWRGWLAPRRLVSVASVAVLILAAFIAGRFLPGRPGIPVAA
ncbi:MAG: hypothetical protein ACRD5L_01685, partial [Bryobacteraceae bacterium]